MSEETNDMISCDPDKKLPESLDIHLRNIMHDKNLNRFRDQLPAEFLSDASEGLNHVNDTETIGFRFTTIESTDAPASQT